MSAGPSLKAQNYFRTGWRPAAMWQYIAVCLFDFMVAPTFSPLAMHLLGMQYHEWHPLTLQGGGMYHISMGAIGGVAVWTRSQELTAPPRRAANGRPDTDNGAATPSRSSRAD